MIILILGLFLLSVSGGEDCKKPNEVDVIIFPESPIGLENRDLFIKITNSKKPLQSCVITSYYENIRNFTLSADHNETQLFYWGNEKDGQCGLILTSVKKTFSGNYQVDIVDESGNVTTCFNLGFKEGPKEIPSKISQVVTVGNKFRQSCIESSDDSENVIYSKIYNPKNELIYEGNSASLTIDSVRKADEGTWKCIVLLENSDIEKVIEIDLQVDEKALIVEKSETATHINLLWKIPEYWSIDYKYEDCFFERPDGKMITLMEGILFERYTYFGNGKEHYECGISIPKPLEKNEIGIWKFILLPRALANTIYEGGFYELKGSSLAESQAETDVSPTADSDEVKIIKGENLTLGCSVKASLTYCYLESPSGKIFNALKKTNQSEPLYTGLGLSIGRCQITVPGTELNENDSGTWICGMGVVDFYEDIQVKIDVTILGNQFTALRKEAEGRAGYSAVIYCQSIHGQGLKYCRFNRPDGKGINLLKNNPTSNKYTYVGEGLDAGVCGLQINPLEDEDFGVWKCSSSFIGDKEEYDDVIELVKRKGLSTYSGLEIGLPLLGLVAVVLVAAIFFYNRRQKQRRYLERTTRNRENDELESSENERRNRLAEEVSSRVTIRRSNSTEEIYFINNNNGTTAFRRNPNNQ